MSTQVDKVLGAMRGDKDSKSPSTSAEADADVQIDTDLDETAVIQPLKVSTRQLEFTGRCAVNQCMYVQTVTCLHRSMYVQTVTCLQCLQISSGGVDPCGKPCIASGSSVFQAACKTHPSFERFTARCGSAQAPPDVHDHQI